MIANGYRLSDLETVFNGMLSPSAVRRDFPPVDVLELDDHYRLEAELPGRSLAEIDVRVEERMLAVASADASSRQGDQTDGRASRRPAFRRTFALPSDVDVKAVSAAYRDGILSVTLPKRPESRPRSIHVE